MERKPLLDGVFLMTYAEIYAFADLNVDCGSNYPTVCRMDIDDLEQVMAEFSFWLYHDLVTVSYYGDDLGHEWGKDKCADLWQLCYQYCTDAHMYECLTLLARTERVDQLFLDWVKEFNLDTHEPYYDPLPGGDEWVLSYVQEHSAGLEEDLYVPIVPMQHESVFVSGLSQSKYDSVMEYRIAGLHGPHSMAWIDFDDSVDFNPFKFDASRLAPFRHPF